MLVDRIEARWLSAFQNVLELCALSASEQCVILSETQSRPLNVHLAELAAQSFGATVSHVVVPTPAQTAPVPVRSTGASQALRGQAAALEALKAADIVLDCTVEGLLHAPELPQILKAGTRVQMISNEHPDALERLSPDPAMKDKVRAAVKVCREATEMTVKSAAGTDLRVGMEGAASAGVWGWTDRPGTIAHWPGGVVVSFPKAGAMNGTLVLDAGDVNLTFKRYLESPVTLTLKDDYVVDIAGTGTEAELMRRYLAAWGDREAYALSHVGWGLEPRARYEALTMYDQRDTNCTELRCYAGNFLFSTGANEFAGRFTEGHFDLPVRGCDIALDGKLVVEKGEVVQ
ncbi:MAG: peptidase M29 [Pseudomonadota bacterium]